MSLIFFYIVRIIRFPQIYLCYSNAIFIKRDLHLNMLSGDTSKIAKVERSNRSHTNARNPYVFDRKICNNCKERLFLSFLSDVGDVKCIRIYTFIIFCEYSGPNIRFYDDEVYSIRFSNKHIV